jgi:hypothetical protein
MNAMNFNKETLSKQSDNASEIKSESKKKIPSNPDTFDEIFGIWKNTDITLEKLRKEAWQRKK